MIQKNLKTSLKVLAMSLLISSSGAFAMKKADFIKVLNDQITVLEAEKADMLGTNASATEYMIILLEAEIAELMSVEEEGTGG